MSIWIILILSFIISTILVNTLQRLFMKILGANVMFFRAKTKLVVIIILAFFFAAFFMQRFGIAIPS